MTPILNPFQDGIQQSVQTAMTDTPQITSSAGKAVLTTRLLQGAKRTNGGWSVPGLSSTITDDAFMQMLNRSAQEDMQDGAGSDLQNLMRIYGLNYISNGKDFTISGFAGSEPRTAPDGSLATNTGTSGTTAGGGTYGGTSGGSFGGGGGGGAARSGGGSAGISPGLPTYGGGGGGSPGLPIVPNAGGTGGVVDPTKAIGLKPIVSQYQPGSSYFSPGGQFPSAGNPFAGLNENSNLYDVISKVAGAQVGNQQAALDILGGLFNESQNGPNSTAFRGRIQDLLANPYSLDEGTIQQILGKTNAGINSRAAAQAADASSRAASAGLRQDSGVVQAQQNAIQSNAGRASGEAERDTRVQAAIQNQQDLRSALGTAGQAMDTDMGRRERIGGNAALGVLGNTAITGDAFLTNALLAAQGKQPAPVNTGPTTGRFYSSFWA